MWAKSCCVRCSPERSPNPYFVAEVVSKYLTKPFIWRVYSGLTRRSSQVLLQKCVEGCREQ
jgi:hypothetical protein